MAAALRKWMTPRCWWGMVAENTGDVGDRPYRRAGNRNPWRSSELNPSVGMGAYNAILSPPFRATSSMEGMLMPRRIVAVVVVLLGLLLAASGPMPGGQGSALAMQEASPAASTPCPATTPEENEALVRR